MTTTRRPLVLGIGNLLMGDEGIGVLAAQLLAGEGLPPDVRVVDGGTGGFHLLGYLSDYDPVVFIDAAMDDRPLGTITILEPRYPSDFPRSLSAHDIGLRDLLESASLLGPLPTMILVTASISGCQPMRAGLSDEMVPILPLLVEQVHRVVVGLRH